MISDIWFNIVPMVTSGALCGLSIAWSYRQAETAPSTRRWITYNAYCTTLLIGLGGVSLLLLEPEYTMAELTNNDNALAMLMQPAAPLMTGGTIIGSLLLWAIYGPRSKTIIPILTTQALLMLLVGHNLAILGLVDIPRDQQYKILEFIGLTIFLAATFALGAITLTKRDPQTLNTRRVSPP
jgi:hypothetical protein